MKRITPLFLGVLLLLAIALPTQTRSSDEKIIEFEAMFGVRAPFTGPTNAIRGVPGAGAPWKISSVKGELNTNGKLEVEVHGLVLVGTGANPVASFRAVVSCQSIDATGAPSIVNLSTGDFPASTTGDAQIEEHFELPNPCIAPIVFVTNPAGRWFTVTGR